MQNEVKANPVAEQAAQLANVAALRAVAAALNTLADALAPVCPSAKAEAEQAAPAVESTAEQSATVVETPAPVKAKKADKKAAEQPKPEPEPAPEHVEPTPEPVAEQAQAECLDPRAAFEDLKARMMALAKSGAEGRDKVRALLIGTGYARLTEVPIPSEAYYALLDGVAALETERTEL